MRVARWRWVLVPMVVLVAGCLPHTTALPASFLDTFNGTNGSPVFTAQPPPAGQTGQDIVAALGAGDPNTPMLHSRAVPVFGVIDCHGVPGCSPGPGGAPGAPARTVWLMLYPDCADAAGDFGWAVVDAGSGVEGGYVAHTPCGP